MTVDLRQDYFELFDLPVDFEVDLELIARRYRDVQRAVHPDRFAQATQQEKLLSLQMTTYVNEAYEVLRSPLKRAIYLMKLKGVEYDDRVAVPTSFLMEQMELHEALEDLTAEREPQLALKRFNRDLDGRVKGLEADIGRMFTEGTEEPVESVRKLQYLYKLREEARRVEERLLEAS